MLGWAVLPYPAVVVDNGALGFLRSVLAVAAVGGPVGYLAGSLLGAGSVPPAIALTRSRWPLHAPAEVAVTSVRGSNPTKSVAGKRPHP
jgi:hypothetical protein